MNARFLLLFLVALAAGFAGVLLFSPGTERGAPGSAPRVVDVPPPANGSSALEEPHPPGGEHRPTVAIESPTLTPANGTDETVTEPTLKELEIYRAHVDPGRIEGIVLAGGAPALEAPVHVWEEGVTYPSDGRLIPPSTAWSTATNSEGVFAFEGLAAGRYRVRVEWDAAQKEIPCEIKAGIGSKRLVCVFGTATITGRVLSAHSVPLIGAVVSASELGPWIGGEGRIARTKTDAEGGYTLAGLMSGRYWVTAGHRELPGGSLDDNPQVRLKSGATFELDLGRAVSGLWRGRLRDADGEPIEGPRLVLLREKSTGLERRLLTDTGGGFHEPLPRGTYDVFVGFQNQVLLAAGSFEMTAADLDGDLTCWTRPVIFQPSCLDCTLSDRQVAVELAKALTLVRNDESGSLFKAEIPRASGELRFYGLPPGEYTLNPGESFGVDLGGEPVTVYADEKVPPRRLTLFRQ